MTITVDIRPEVKAELSRQARVQGRAIEAMAAILLEEAMHLSVEPAKQQQRKSLVEVCAMVKGLTDDVEFTRNLSTGRAVDLG